jgi:hypothetical protein
MKKTFISAGWRKEMQSEMVAFLAQQGDQRRQGGTS